MTCFSSPSLSSSMRDSSGRTQQMMSQLMREIQIEESLIDKKMAEIQAMCLCTFRSNRIRSGWGSSPLGFVQAEFKQIEGVITKAHQLRFKALELVMKKVLTQIDVAEFLVPFSGIQDIIH